MKKHYRLNKEKFTTFILGLLVIGLFIYIVVDLGLHFENYVTSNFWRP